MKHVQPELEFKLVPKWLRTYEKLISDLICFPLKGGSLLGIGWVLLGSCGVLLGVLPGVCWRRSMGKTHAGDSGAKFALVTPALQTLVPPKDKALKALKGLRSDKAFKGLLIRPFKDFDRAFRPFKALIRPSGGPSNRSYDALYGPFKGIVRTFKGKALKWPSRPFKGPDGFKSSLSLSLSLALFLAMVLMCPKKMSQIL